MTTTMDDTTKLKTAAPSRRAARRIEPMVAPAAQARIGTALRELYDGMKAEPLPDKLATLLQQPERGETPTALEADAPPEAHGRA